jgi:hypothetical protein
MTMTTDIPSFLILIEITNAGGVITGTERNPSGADRSRYQPVHTEAWESRHDKDISSRCQIQKRSSDCKVPSSVFWMGGGTLSLGNVEATGVRTKPIRGRVESFITSLV